MGRGSPTGPPAGVKIENLPGIDGQRYSGEVWCVSYRAAVLPCSVSGIRETDLDPDHTGGKNVLTGYQGV